jgi:hypothetical protein
MTWLRVLLVLGFLGRAAYALEPPLHCIAEPSTETGYVWGSLYAGLWSEPNPCAVDPRGFDRFPVLLVASPLLQLDATAGTGAYGERIELRRARLTLAARFWRRFELVGSGDAAERSIPDAHLQIRIMAGLTLIAGRRVVPFGLETQWSDGKLPFLEHASVIDELAPIQRQHGASLSAAVLQELDRPSDSSDSARSVLWHAEVGVFQPFDERASYTVIGRAFGRLERENDANNFHFDLHLGASAAIGQRVAETPTNDVAVPDGEERRVAIEAEARYRRVSATAELVSVTQEMRTPTSTRALLEAVGGALTLRATLRPNPYRWSTEPLRRYPIRSFRHVDPLRSTPPNIGSEVDLGVDLTRGGISGTAVSTTKLRAALHSYDHDFVKVSCAYAYALESHEHVVTARVQLAL